MVFHQKEFQHFAIKSWRSKIKWKTEFIIQYSQEFGAMKDIEVSKGYTHKMYSKVFSIP